MLSMYVLEEEKSSQANEVHFVCANGNFNKYFNIEATLLPVIIKLNESKASAQRLFMECCHKTCEDFKANNPDT